MEDLLISFDDLAYNNHISQLNSVKRNAEKAIEIYHSLDVGKFQPDEKRDLIFNIESYLFRKLMDKHGSEINGVKMSREKMFELMEKPVGYNQLIQQITSLNSIVEAMINSVYPSPFKNRKKDQIISMFDWSNASEEIKIFDKSLTEIKKFNEIYATSEKAKFHYLLGNKICDLLNNEGYLKNIHQYQIDGNKTFDDILNCIKVPSTTEGNLVLDIEKIKLLNYL